MPNAFSRYTGLSWFLSTTKNKQFITASIVVVILSLVVSGIVAQVFVVNTVNVNFAAPPDSPNKIFTFVDFISVDATAGTLTLDWYPITDCSTTLNVDFYFDPNLLAPNSANTQVPSDSKPTTPIFHFNSDVTCQTVSLASSDIFRTVSRLIGNDFSSNPGGKSANSLQNYPFDTYIAVAAGFALDSSNNASVGMETPTPLGSTGTPIDFVVVQSPSSSNDASAGLNLILNVKRSAAVKAFAVLIVIVNWIVTIAFLCITVASVIWPEGVVKEMFVLPIATLFAFSAVRANMPGAPPGFGCVIDYVGILPNLALMTICSAVLLFVILVRRIKGPEAGPKATHKKPTAASDGDEPRDSSTPKEPLSPASEKSPHTSMV